MVSRNVVANGQYSPLSLVCYRQQIKKRLHLFSSSVVVYLFYPDGLGIVIVLSLFTAKPISTSYYVTGVTLI